MSNSGKTIDTAYGRVDRTNLEAIRDGYDTQGLLAAIDELDEFLGEVRSDGGLRDVLLRLHAVAHTVVNDAPMVVSHGHENLPELANEVTIRLRDAVSLFQTWIRRVEPLECLTPND